MLDAVMSPEWESRYFSFDSRWAPDEEMASMRNGSGDEWSIVFSPAGAFVRGFDHESEMSPYANGGRPWPGVVESVPEVFAACVADSAFSDGGTLLATVCLWRQIDDDRWHVGGVDYAPGEDPDGADWLFEMLMDGTPAGYGRFAEEYHETQIDLSAVSAVLSLEPLTNELAQRLNPDVVVDDLTEDLSQIRYPRPG
jgi:hypothetical protein